MAPGKTGVRAGRKSASVRSNHIHGTFFHRRMHWSEHGLQATAGVMLYIMGTIRGSTAMAMRLSTFQKGAVGSGWSRSCWPVVVVEDVESARTARGELGIEFQPSADHLQLAKQLTALPNGSRRNIQLQVQKSATFCRQIRTFYLKRLGAQRARMV